MLLPALFTVGNLDPLRDETQRDRDEASRDRKRLVTGLNRESVATTLPLLSTMATKTGQLQGVRMGGTGRAGP